MACRACDLSATIPGKSSMKTRCRLSLFRTRPRTDCHSQKETPLHPVRKRTVDCEGFLSASPSGHAKAPTMAYVPRVTFTVPAKPLVNKQVTRELVTPGMMLMSRAMGHDHASHITIWVRVKLMQGDRSHRVRSFEAASVLTGVRLDVRVRLPALGAPHPGVARRR